MNNQLYDLKNELTGYMAELESVCDSGNGSDKLSEEMVIIREHLKGYTPSLMFYGIYNAGKSTLLNAVFGEYKASVADVPETNKVTEYPWKGYVLVDTPGINGPQADYILSVNELVKHDVILFVIDDSETFDHKLVSQEVVKIIKSEKQLIIVLNQKQVEEAEEEDFERFQVIRTKFFSNIQEEARIQGISNVEKKYSFISVNALSAYNGRKFNSEELIQESLILDLENLIMKTLKEMEGPKKLKVPADLMIHTLKFMQEELQGSLKLEEERELYTLLENILVRKNTLTLSLQQKIRQEIYQSSQVMIDLLSNGKEVEQVSHELQDRIEQLIKRDIENGLQSLQVELETSHYQMDVAKLVVDVSPAKQEISTAKSIVATKEKKPHIDFGGVAVSGLFGKEITKILPVIAKGGSLTIPPVIIIEGIRLLFNWFSESQKNKQELERLQAQVAEANANQKQFIQQRMAAIQEMNTKVRVKMYQYEEQVITMMQNHVDDIFGEMEKGARGLIQTSQNEQTALEQRIEDVRELSQKVERFKMKTS